MPRPPACVMPSESACGSIWPTIDEELESVGKIDWLDGSSGLSELDESDAVRAVGALHRLRRAGR